MKKLILCILLLNKYSCAMLLENNKLLWELSFGADTKLIYSYKVLNRTATISKDEINLTLACDTSSYNISPEISHNAYTIIPDNKETIDFKYQNTYLLIAEDGSSKKYKLKVEVAASNSKDITNFKLKNIKNTKTKINDNKIIISIPEDANSEEQIIEFEITGASLKINDDIIISNQAILNLEDISTIEVSDCNGDTKEYKFILIKERNSKAYSIKDFKIDSFTISGTEGEIYEENLKIIINLGSGIMQLNSLNPELSYTGYGIYPEIKVTDFSKPKYYYIFDEDLNYKKYEVIVNKIDPSLKRFNSFSFKDVDANTTIYEGYIIVVINEEISLEGLVANFAYEGTSVEINSKVQESGITANNFTNELIYTIFDTSGNKKDYRVKVFVNIRAGLTFNFIDDLLALKYVPSFSTYISATSNTETEINNNPYLIAEAETSFKLWHSVHSWGIDNSFIFTEAKTYKGETDLNFDTENQPVAHIGFKDAIVFSNALTAWYNSLNNYEEANIKALSFVYKNSYGQIIKDVSQVDQRTLVSDANATGFRLLTDEEWELAARYKGENSRNSIESPSGSNIYWLPNNFASGASLNACNFTETNDYAWYNLNSSNLAKDIKQKNPNTLGIYDMSGNIAELVYKKPGISGLIIRGGAYDNEKTSIRVGSYIIQSIDYTSHNLGLRIAKTFNAIDLLK